MNGLTLSTIKTHDSTRVRSYFTRNKHGETYMNVDVRSKVHIKRVIKILAQTVETITMVGTSIYRNQRSEHVLDCVQY